MSAAETKRSGTSRGLKFTNTLTREKEDFRAIDDGNVRLYVCGPTVYDFAHIGNARPVIVFDVLYRLLRYVYGADHVTYVRNITDVDDKINARALRDHPDLPLNDAIAKVTQKTADQFHKDIKALNVLDPDHEPRATQHIDGMVRMIGKLIEKGHAYEAGGEVLFNTASMSDYGELSKRTLEEQLPGARIAVDEHKKNPSDFVLWKLSTEDEPGWESPWGRGRPGWHIECSVMSEHHLGEVFDIHGGGLDLIFPHHENEIAQSRCAHNTPTMANYWLHNGFLQVEGQKMSKSLGNFLTISQILKGEYPGWNGGPWHGLVLRTAMLMTHYRQPIDWTLDRLLEARALMGKWYLILGNFANENEVQFEKGGFASFSTEPFVEVKDALCDDLNTPRAISFLSGFLDREKSVGEIGKFISSLSLLGLLDEAALAAYPVVTTSKVLDGGSDLNITSLAFEYGIAKANNDVEMSKSISNELANHNWMIVGPDRNHIELTTIENTGIDIQALVELRLNHLRAKSWALADEIRAELAAKGILLKDSKDSETGERITTWEVQR